MSNNEPDYENDLVFPPQEIKSQHELSEQGRQSEVLIATIEKCEKLEKEIIALKKEYQAECIRADELEDSLQTSWQDESKLKEQLNIAIKALESYANDKLWSDTSEELFFFDGCFCSNGYQLAQDALKQIGEKK